MKIKIERIFTNDVYCIGKLYVDDVYLCDTLEDCDRGLDQKMSIEEIKSKKIKHLTAIPTGKYLVELGYSPRFSNNKFYQSLGGKLPRIQNVPGYEGVLIHCGNTHQDTDGCILLGLNQIKGMVIDSRKCFVKLMERLNLTQTNGSPITLEIIRKY